MDYVPMGEIHGVVRELNQVVLRGAANPCQIDKADTGNE